MLPAFLFNTYKRYKQETDDFIGWLSSTAQSCGYKTSTSAETSLPSRSGQNRYQIQLSSFLPLARAIAGFEPKIPIPTHIEQKGLRIVSLRKKCANWFTTQAQISQKAIVTHAHFIETFEKVLQTLGIRPPVAPATGQAQEVSKLGSEAGTGQAGKNKKKKKVNTRARVDETLSRFTALTLHDTASDDLEGAKLSTGTQSVITARTQTRAKTAQYEVSDDISDDEDEPSVMVGNGPEQELNRLDAEFDILAVFCLMEDLKHTAEYIDQLWTDYKSGKVDLMTAAVVTNTAIDFVRRQCEDESLSRLGLDDATQATNSVYMLLCELRNEPPQPSKKSGDPYNFNMHDTVRWCYLDTFLLLQSLTNAHEPGELSSYRPGYFGNFDPKKSRSDLSPREQFTEDKIIMAEMLPHFSFLVMGKSDLLPVADEFTSGMMDMLNSGEIPFWLCFAARIYLDVQHALRPEPDIPFKQLSLAAKRIKKTLNSYFDFSEFMMSPNWPKQNDEALKQVLQQIDMFITHDVFVVVKHRFQRDNSDEHRFLKRSCVLTGIMLFNFNLRIREAGEQLGNAWGSVIYPAFLYNEIQNEGLVSISWPDIEQVIKLHGEKNVFADSRPKDIEATFLQAQAMLGFSMKRQDWENFDGKNAPSTKEGPQGLCEPTVISKILKDRYMFKGPVDVSLRNVEDLLNDLAKKDEAVRSAASSAIKQNWSATRKLNTLELLALLRERLMDEERMLVFNYFGLHQRCVGLLRLLKDEHHAKFLQYYGPKYLEHEYQLSFVCNWIFTVARGSKTAAEQLQMPTPAGTQRASAMMTKSGKLMQAWLKQNGGVAVKELANTVINKHLLDPVKAAENKSLGLLDSGYLVPMMDLLGIDPEYVKAAQADMRDRLNTAAGTEISAGKRK